MMTELDLPSYPACSVAVYAGMATPLETFIFHHEPSGAKAEARFRNEFVAALNEVISDEHS